MADGKAAVVETVVNLSGNVDPKLKKAVDETNGLVGKVGKAMKAAGIAALAASAGKALAELASEYSEATKTIRRGTGATGEALEGLRNDLQAVMKDSVFSADESAKAIANLNTYLGLSGEELQAVTQATERVAFVLGEDLGSVVESTSRAMKAWNLESENAEEDLNAVRKVAQATGVSLSDIQQGLVRNQAALKQAGFGYRNAAAFIGQMNRAGLNAEEILAGMRRAASKGYDWTDVIYTLETATTDQERMNIASEIFGERSAPAVAQAAAEGKLAIGDLNAALEANTETLEEAYKGTMTFADEWERFKNKELSGIGKWAEDLGVELLHGLEGYFDNYLKPFIQNIFSEDFWYEVWKGFGVALDEAASSAWKAVKAKLADDPNASSVSDSDTPWLASGGLATRPSICGEAGPEMVISMDPAYRAQNLAYLAQAQAMLGAGGGQNIDMSGMVFAPTVQTSGSATDVMAALRANEREFSDMVAGAISGRASRGLA